MNMNVHQKFSLHFRLLSIGGVSIAGSVASSSPRCGEVNAPMLSLRVRRASQS